MIEGLRRVLEDDPRIGYALTFGSHARGTAHAGGDIDLGIGVREGKRLEPLEIGALITYLQSAAGGPVDLVLLDEAPPGLAYRVFRDGRPLFVRDEAAFKNRLARAILDYLDFRPIEELFTRGVLRPAMVDKALLAAKIAAVRDAVERIRTVLPADPEAFISDRTAREVVVLNLFVALQDCVALASHWLADDGLDVPASYADVFRRLGERGTVPTDLAARLAGARENLDDLLMFCDTLARQA